MVVSLFPQSYLTSDQVLAIMGEGQSTEGSPETQSQFNTILVPTARYKHNVACSLSRRSRWCYLDVLMM